MTCNTDVINAPELCNIQVSLTDFVGCICLSVINSKFLSLQRRDAGSPHVTSPHNNMPRSQNTLHSSFRAAAKFSLNSHAPPRCNSWLSRRVFYTLCLVGSRSALCHHVQGARAVGGLCGGTIVWLTAVS
jgi:hypothetical protein